MARSTYAFFATLIVALTFATLVSATPTVPEGSCPEEGNIRKGSAFVQKAVAPLSQVRLQPQEIEEGKLYPPSLSEVDASGKISVVSYNLYWWNVKQNNRWSQLHSRISSERPFDLIGFQECEDVASVVSGSSLNGFDYYQGPKPNPAPLAWNAQVFSKIGGPGNKWIASDRWGNRHLTWVRLRHNPSGANIFFANTHGPLGNCGSTVGNNWVRGVNDNKQAGDIVFVTGDFNCGTGTPAMNLLKGQLTNGVDGGIDQILTDQGRKEWGGKREGSPSDHPLIKGSFGVSGSNGGGSVSTRRRRNPTSGGQTSGNCQDGNGQCASWAANGECARNPGYMSLNCKKSCNACPQSGGSYPARQGSNPQISSGCRDDSQQCAAWAGNGECTRNPQYMTVSCKRSCNACR